MGLPYWSEQTSGRTVPRKLAAVIEKVGQNRGNKKTGSSTLPVSQEINEWLSLEWLDFDAHLPGGAGDDPVGRFFGTRVQILHLDLYDVLDLLLRELCHLLFVRLLGTRGDVRGFLDQD